MVCTSDLLLYIQQTDISALVDYTRLTRVSRATHLLTMIIFSPVCLPFSISNYSTSVSIEQPQIAILRLDQKTTIS